MPFTEAEKRKWHANRNLEPDDSEFSAALVCGHCGNPFAYGCGVATDDFALCDVCNGD